MLNCSRSECKPCILSMHRNCPNTPIRSNSSVKWADLSLKSPSWATKCKVSSSWARLTDLGSLRAISPPSEGPAPPSDWDLLHSSKTCILKSSLCSKCIFLREYVKLCVYACILARAPWRFLPCRKPRETFSVYSRGKLVCFVFRNSSQVWGQILQRARHL